jgi:purine-binding chemotaxis protein CheW
LAKREGTLAALHCLVCKIGERTCALPLEHVREVMRPAAVDHVEPAPKYLLGLAVVRGETVPVVDAAQLLAGGSGLLARWVVLRVGARRVAFGVAEVLGVRALERTELRELPPLLAGSSDRVRGLAVLDGALLEVLESGWVLEVAARDLEGAALTS